MRPVSFFLMLAVAGCGASSQPPIPSAQDGKGEKQGDTATAPPSSGDDAASGGAKVNPEQGPPSGINFGCRLPAPVTSDDACTKDADCAPNVPCHARACVAARNATPRTPDTVCTMNIDCLSADVNPCSCYEGRCALVPKSP